MLGADAADRFRGYGQHEGSARHVSGAAHRAFRAQAELGRLRRIYAFEGWQKEVSWVSGLCMSWSSVGYLEIRACRWYGFGYR